MNGLFTPIDGGMLLNELNLNDHGTQLKILSYDKHQTVEGLYIEPFAMNYMNALARFGVSSIDVVTVLAKNIKEQRGPAPARCVFIWDRSLNQDSKRYIELLRSLHPKTTYIIDYDDYICNFFCFKPENSAARYPLQEYLRRKREMDKISFPVIDAKVKDTVRHNSAFWGRLIDAFKNEDEFKNEVLLNRMLKNFAIQPFFKFLWDLDRIISYKNRFWELELKHKYPFSSPDGLAFGINVGQAKLINELAAKGLNTLHLILVKPSWSKEIAPGYIFNQKDVQRKVLLIGMVINKQKIQQAMAGHIGKSDESTSFTGKNQLNYCRLPAKSFFLLGSYEDPIERVAENILTLLNSEFSDAPVQLTPVTDQLLLDNKL
jgi:hypothetical protein